MKAAVINGSARDGSNSDLLARVVVEGLPHEVVQLGIDKLPHIDDRRHANPSFGPVNAAYGAIMERILDCPVWVFASPVYWYGFSGIMKDFVDLWSHIMRVPEWQFQKRMAGKHAFLVLVGGDNPIGANLPRRYRTDRHVCEAVRKVAGSRGVIPGTSLLIVENLGQCDVSHSKSFP